MSDTGDNGSKDEKKDIRKVLSLSRARKSRARDEKRREADANAALHGRNKLARLAEEAEAARVKRVLDAHKRDDE